MCYNHSYFKIQNLVLISIMFLNLLHARQGFGPSDQEWGHITVRKGAHMFWWLHKTLIPTSSNNRKHFSDRPLVIWLQGGPGVSSTAYGNFAEIGPLDSDLKNRENTWLKDVNLLFVDNPVGCGYSYIEEFGEFATTNREIAQDFLVFLRGFYEAIPELRNTPLYIFSESYGGKMTVEITLAIHQAVEKREINVKLLGVGLGSSWISPIDCVLSWAPYLLNLGFVDQRGYSEISKSAEATAEAVKIGNYSYATKLWGITERIIIDVTDGVHFYNVLTKFSAKKFRHSNNKLSKLMKNGVKEALKLNHTFKIQSRAVFEALREDFMKPVTEIVELLLNTTNIQVAVFNGQLDLMVPALSTMAWLQRLSYPDSSEWQICNRSAIIVDGIDEGFYKKVGNLAMYWVNRAGHMIPADNPNAMRFILKEMLLKIGK